MITSVQQWVTYLKEAGGLIGVPLALGGLVLMAGGWRLWRPAIVLSFGVIGAAAGACLAPPMHPVWLYALGGAVLLGAASFPKPRYSVSLLGGIVGAGIVNYACEAVGLGPPTLWVVTGIALLAATAVAFLDVRQVIIMVTAFEGAVLVVSAAVAFVAEMPGLFNYFRSMAYGGGVFVPFLLLVPTVVGTLLQMADAKQKDSGLVRG